MGPDHFHVACTKAQGRFLAYNVAIRTRGSLGKGGTAKVSQSMINIETSFAFKRMEMLSPVRAAADPLRDSFERLISELLVLRNPLLLAHRNIVDLVGICWEVSYGSEDALPVLVLKKS